MSKALGINPQHWNKNPLGLSHKSKSGSQEAERWLPRLISDSG